LLVGEQLEEAAEREERRPQLVRGIRDELAARVLELRKPAAHSLEGARELADLVFGRVDDRLVEAAARDPLRRPLQASKPPREEPGAAVADQKRQGERERAGEQQPALDEVDVAERVVQRRRKQQNRSR